MANYLYIHKNITLNQKRNVMKVNSRAEILRRFMSLILTEFDKSTYDDMKASISEHSSYITHRLEEEERECG